MKKTSLRRILSNLRLTSKILLGRMTGNHKQSVQARCVHASGNTGRASPRVQTKSVLTKQFICQ